MLVTGLRLNPQRYQNQRSKDFDFLSSTSKRKKRYHLPPLTPMARLRYFRNLKLIVASLTHCIILHEGISWSLLYLKSKIVYETYPF